MVRRNPGRYPPSAGTVVILAAAVGLVINLATNTVEVSWHWWPLTVWTAATLLVTVSAIVEVARHRRGENSPSDRWVPSTRVFGRIPLPANHLQPRLPETQALHRALGGRGRAALVALPGTRGTGKTQLAAAYARQCDRDGYDLVAWINAESSPIIGLAELGRDLGLATGNQAPEQQAAAAVRLLEGDDPARRLVVFDNAVGPEAIVGFLPSRGTTKVIITSNRQEFTTMAGVTAVPVHAFTEAEGRRYLREATGLTDGPMAVRLGTELDWLPLGLAQAAAYITRNKLTYRDYLDLLDEHHLDQTLRPQSGADHPGVLKTTLLSLAGLVREDPTGSAMRLLGVLALLSADGISRRLLVTGSAALRLGTGLTHSLDRLINASLVTLSGAADDTQDSVVVVVHRLTARVVRYHLTQPDADLRLDVAGEAATALLHILTTRLSDEQIVYRRAELDEITSHLVTLRRHLAAPPPLLLADGDRIGRALRKAGDLKRAMPLLTDILNDRIRILGPDHPDTLVSANNVAIVHETAGQLDEATALNRRILSDRERVLGFHHRDTLLSRNNLAHVLLNGQQLPEAIALYESVLADRTRLLGPDHPDTLYSRNNLAYAYWSAGRSDEAVDLFEAVCADRARVLGADHPDTLSSRNNLAGAMESSGRLDEAIGEFEQVVGDRARVLDVDHPDTLSSRNNLAHAYETGGRTGEAIALFTAVLADRERVLGADHPHTLSSRGNLAHAYETDGRLDEAIERYREVLADMERLLSPKHRFIATVRENLAAALARRDTRSV